MRLFLLIPSLLLLAACGSSGGECRDGTYSDERLAAYCCGAPCYVRDQVCVGGSWEETNQHCDCFPDTCGAWDSGGDTLVPDPADVSSDTAADVADDGDIRAADTDDTTDSGADDTDDVSPDTATTDSGADDITAPDAFDSAVVDVGDDAADSEASDVSDATSGPCPPDMALVDDVFCVDRYEAMLEEWVDGAWVRSSPYATVGSRRVRAVVARGEVPQGYVSGVEAAAACSEAGKRLCTNDEWISACRGPANTRWPYGDTYDAEACNDTYAGGHPVVNYFGTAEGVWDAEHMNDPGINQQDGTVSSGGEMAACVSAWGIYDLHGNLHEWTSDPAGTFRGGFYGDGRLNGQGCTYVTTAHHVEYHDYSTGFRCCADRE